MITRRSTASGDAWLWAVRELRLRIRDMREQTARGWETTDFVGGDGYVGRVPLPFPAFYT